MAITEKQSSLSSRIQQQPITPATSKIFTARFFLWLIFYLAIFSTTSQAEKLTLARIYSSPSLNGEVPRKVQFSPDGKLVSYLKAKTNHKSQYDLWVFNIKTQNHQLLVNANKLSAENEQLSDEEKARRERQRLFAQGIIEYAFSPDSKALIFPLNGNIYYYDLTRQQVQQLTKSEDFDTDVKFSPKGNYLSFIRQQNIYLYHLKSQQEIRLTKDGAGVIKNGMAEFIAQEEMGRMTGYWWSPTEAHIAFLQVDESPVAVTKRNEIYPDDIKTIEQRYPFTGTNNVKVSIALANIDTQKIKHIKHHSEVNASEDGYIARLDWLPSGESFSYQWQSRDQKTLALRRYQLASEQQKTLITENSQHWLNLHDDLFFLKQDKSFIWASERDGFKHLYHYHQNGQLIKQLSQGAWVVDELAYVDEKNGWLYFTGRADSVLEKHLYKVPLFKQSSAEPIKITELPGMHDITFSLTTGAYLDVFSNVSTQKNISLNSINTINSRNNTNINTNAKNSDPNISSSKKIPLTHNHLNSTGPLAKFQDELVLPSFGTLKTKNNTSLYYKIFKPKTLIANKKYPVIVKVYGGPHVQRVTNQWQKINLTQYLVQQGFIVFQLDNRGSNKRGTAFEFPIHKQLGKIELEDQITGVKFLQTLPYVDKDNIGIYGHSYGGYMAIMAMLNAEQYFSAGVAGAPVTDWLLYDSHYTERYLSHPDDNQQGYKLSGVFPYTKNLTKPLFIYHGMADDNVLFTHTSKLIKQLQDQNKHFELMTYPGSKHSMRGKQVKIHLGQSIVNFFNRHLKSN
ncbi:MAG: DPP IV N-terminal domain-containing protein [Thalassotalea sp.]